MTTDERLEQLIRELKRFRVEESSADTVKLDYLNRAELLRLVVAVCELHQIAPYALTMTQMQSTIVH